MSKEIAEGLLREIKAVFAGEALPHWQQNMDTTLMRGHWLDRIDACLAQVDGERRVAAAWCNEHKCPTHYCNHDKRKSPPLPDERGDK